MSSGFHRSKEVYKFTNTQTGRKLVPIRGLYVSGLHTEPRYIDHLISVTDFASTPTNLVNYTEKSENVYNAYIQSAGFGNIDPTVTYYTTDTKNMNQAACVQGIGFGSIDPTLVYYTSDAKNMNQAACVQSVGFDDTNLTIINIPTISVSSAPDHLIKINNFTSSTTVVTNVNT